MGCVPALSRIIQQAHFSAPSSSTVCLAVRNLSQTKAAHNNAPCLSADDKDENQPGLRPDLCTCLGSNTKHISVGGGGY